MSAGDPMNRCPLCGEVYYMVNGHNCPIVTNLVHQYGQCFNISAIPNNNYYSGINGIEKINKMSNEGLIWRLVRISEKMALTESMTMYDDFNQQKFGIINEILKRMNQ